MYKHSTCTWGGYTWQLALVVLFLVALAHKLIILHVQIATCTVMVVYIHVYEHEAIRIPKSENNIGAPLALQKRIASSGLPATQVHVHACFGLYNVYEYNQR